MGFRTIIFVDSIHREGMCSLIDRDGLGGRSGTEIMKQAIVITESIIGRIATRPK